MYKITIDKICTVLLQYCLSTNKTKIGSINDYKRTNLDRCHLYLYSTLYPYSRYCTAPDY